MGLLVEFDVINDFGYIEATEEYGIIPDYSYGCNVFVKTFLKIARELVPVDTGYLKYTLRAECDDTYCCAETNCEYAQYPEYGTWCQAAQPYFTPALEKAIAAAQPFWDEAEEAALAEEEMLIMEEIAQRGRLDFAGSREKGSWQFGSINFSSPAAFIGSLIGMFVAAFIITTVQVIAGKDFSSSGYDTRHRGANDSFSGVYIPDVIIT